MEYSQLTQKLATATLPSLNEDILIKLQYFNEPYFATFRSYNQENVYFNYAYDRDPFLV
jgi:hypothetical protein